ncbi:hypothetical protein RB195_000156 [Necator americanus]|uniref:Uncharacterized protein n=1 Tax=Necator americanus TaxID=51031 RepID=A0ABR1D896_NECAM
MEQLKEIVYDRVHNQKWFTARGLKTLAGATGWGEEALARLIACILFLILVTSKNWIVCNSILVGVSLLLMYVFPDERPPAENMRVYWISAFVVTAFDRMLEAFPLYYVGKLCALLFLLVEPSCLNERLKTLLKLTYDPIKDGSSSD